jgi:hypothetical protein
VQDYMQGEYGGLGGSTVLMMRQGKWISWRRVMRGLNSGWTSLRGRKAYN